MNILFLSAEAEPFIKVGGLADVAGALPQALHQIDPTLDVRLVIPYHQKIKQQNLPLEPIAAFTIAHQDGIIPVQAYRLEKENLKIDFISAEPITNAPSVYSPDAGFDGYKYTLFTLASLRLVEILRWTPDIVHANDWHAAMAIPFLANKRFPQSFFEHTKTLLTIHNLPYMGQGAQPSMQAFGIGNDLPMQTSLPNWALGIPLPMAIATADKINTVSQTYAQEMRTPEFGCGLQEVLKSRESDLSGITNGIDMNIWNPRTDCDIPQQYDRFTSELKEENKKKLLASLGLNYTANKPLIALISRLEYQKGIDQAIQALNHIHQSYTFIGLGTGNPQIEALMQDFQANHYQNVRALIKYDNTLAHQIYAAADLILMPSLYEPCGITQMIAMRYGTIPVVSHTGGLADTVIPHTQPNGTGLLATPNNPHSFQSKIEQALSLYYQKSEWLRIQRNAMNIDFSWLTAAQKYKTLYKNMLKPKE